MKSTAAATVNGIGFWKNLTRNFKEPLLAFLDLLDNAVDAVGATKHIDINREDSGISLVNTCQEKIPDLMIILELFTSKKGDTSQIGENGIGLKQGCACLSDLSFICTKSNDRLQLGIIAKELQSEDEILLPSLVIENPKLLRQEICAWLDDNPFMKNAIRPYGKDNSLSDAVHRLEENFSKLQDDYPNDQHVFGLFLHDVKQGKGDTTQRAKTLLYQIVEDLPSRYLHIPEHVEVTVCKERIRFNYWQARLVEMAQFKLYVNPNIPLHQDPDWKIGLTFPDVVPEHQVPFRLYVGFDALRASSKNEDALPNLYIYSRSSGRKIIKYKDARSAIQMGGSGGTLYCQGLTILLDDCETSLPLNPTKQDTAFAERATGVIFQKNLYMWVSVAVRCYYNRYLEIFHKERKQLSKALADIVPEIRVMDSNTTQKPLEQCEYGTFQNYVTSVVGDSIRLANSSGTRFYHSGRDILFQLQQPQSKPVATPKKRKVEEQERAEAGKQVVPPPVLGGLMGSTGTEMNCRDLQALLEQKAARYQNMKNKKRSAQEQALVLEKELVAARKQIETLRDARDSSMTDADYKLEVADLREQLAEQKLSASARIQELEDRLEAATAALAEQSFKHSLETQDKDDEITRLTTQAEYFKKKRDELLEAQEED